MNIEATKLELMHLLLQTQKASLLDKLKKVFEEEQTDWWDDLTKDEKDAVELGLNQADKNEVISNDDVMKKFNKWRS